MSGPGLEGTTAAIGEEYRIAGYALAGVRLFTAGDPGAVRRAWAELEPDVALVFLTPAAAAALEALPAAGTGPLTVVLP